MLPQGSSGFLAGALAAGILGGLAACQDVSVSSPAEPHFNAEQLAAAMPADLGSSALDVSAYPEEQQNNYRLFSSRCSQCHTLARAINSPFFTREDWTRYVQRMRARLPVERVASPQGETRLVRRASNGKFRGVLPASEVKRLIDFLVYDSAIRKADWPLMFRSEQVRLAALFVQVQKYKQTHIETLRDRTH